MWVCICLTFLSAFAADEFEELEDEEEMFIDEIERRQELDPVVLVPGLAGSHLEYRNKTGTKWSTLWLDFARTLPGLLPKYIKDIKTHYDPVNETFLSANHIEVRPVDFGGVKGIKYLDPVVKTVTRMFNTIVKAFKKAGYQTGKNLFGAPYDWRIAHPKTCMENGMFANFKDLVEKASNLNNGKKVHLIGHSCGCIFIHTFMTRYVTQDWVDQYVASFISISGPYGGATEAFAHLASPHKWSIPTVGAKATHEMAKEFGSIFWMLPNKNAYADDTIIATIPSIGETITLRNMSHVFTSTNRYLADEALAMTQRYIDRPIKAPHVPVHFIIGRGKKTTKAMQYEGAPDSWWHKQGKNIIGDGDGTVPIESLRCALKWKDEQHEEITLLELKYSHTGILHKKESINHMLSIISR
ncbi:putative lysophospholipase III [Monocercomonoides exilis]|uniref:putative lysophospholipase III n=1 Tax=Monocercomonoides exilis TaxID=2049356 RepID=UPI00355AC184|nr:putative lysophospholipase III [Monocercomonoides exilis]|eukprot:MONOS_3760.1-p1 / transcript=MONOS_3760.1 / gene=MONOS_3760 / organism=Monocercomonoides_exilis_PA203 / gene_product= lysophospholipase III [EC:3.1.1.5] / transcript_product= lysophospholipase III [EC:3.1.1.5] / location=Mono_scaffold00091:114570-116178(-) / protein_length=413 / sequence_SO=supercontig / SO=protein_coding / is_pseudo=false